MMSIRRFGPWQFCPETLTLTTEGQSQHLEPRVAQLLLYFLDHQEELLSHDRLIDAVWEGRVVSDEAVRRAVSNLRHALTLEGTSSPIRTVHKGGYIAQFPPAPPVESAADPPVRSNPVKVAERGNRRRPLMALAVAVVGLSILLLFQYRTAWFPGVADSDPPRRTIAVLPFTTSDPDRDAAYLAEGVADELLTLLGRVPAFQVTARGSSFLFRDATVDPRVIGERLGVRYLVQGTVQQVGEKVRIIANLVDARSGFQLWSERYDRDLADIFAVQEDIATKIARKLQVVLVRADGKSPQLRHPVSVAAHMAYLEGLRAMNSGIVADLEQAIGRFERAIELDPQYAAAHAQLAKVFTVYMQNAPVNGAQREALEARARELLERALALEPGLGMAYIHRASLLDSTQEIEADLRRGLALNPSYAPGYEALAEELYFYQGRHAEGLAMIDKARALDPLLPRTHHLKSYMMLDQCQYDEAEALERQALRADPRFRSAFAQLGVISGYRGDRAREAWYVERALALDPDATWLRARLVVIYLNLDDLPAAMSLNDPENLDMNLALLIFNGKPEEAAATLIASGEEEWLQAIPWHMGDVLLQGAMASGRYSHARQFIAQNMRFTWDEARLPEDERIPSRLYKALLEFGPDLSVQERQVVAGLRDRLVESMRLKPDCKGESLSWYLALAEIFLENETGALRLLQQAAADGSLPPWFWWSARAHPAFAPLRGNPGFQALVAAQEQQTTAQRERLRQLRHDV
jgi:TolB-like protein/DNA-binding winged helix-turn-helix (wHTH) protein